MSKHNYYVSCVDTFGGCLWSHKPIRALNPRHAIEKFLGPIGVKLYNSGEPKVEKPRVVLWKDRNYCKYNLNTLKGTEKNLFGPIGGS